MTLKKDLLKIGCYLLGHRPERILTAGGSLGVSILTECSRCRNTLAWEPIRRMTPNEAYKNYEILREKPFEFRNETSGDSQEIIDRIQWMLIRKMMQGQGLSEDKLEKLIDMMPASAGEIIDEIEKDTNLDKMM